MTTIWDKTKHLSTTILLGAIMWVVIMRHFNFTSQEMVCIGVDFAVYCIGFFLLAYWNKTISPHFYILICYLSMLSIILFFRLKDLQEVPLGSTVWKPIKSLAVVLIAYMIGYFLSKTDAYKQRVLQVALIVAGPVLFVLARLTGGVRGVYNWVGGIMPSEISKISFLFAVIYIFTYGGTAKKKLRLFLGYLVIQGVCCVWANEYGTLLVIAISAFIVCLLDKELRNLLVAFIVVGILGGGLIMLCSVKVRTRFMLFLDPLGSLESESAYVSEQAKIMERFLKNVNYTDWNGSGFKLILSNLPPNMCTDYVVQTIILEFGILVALIVLAAFVIVFFYLLSVKTGNELERKILDAVVILMASTSLVVIGGNLLIMPMAGLTTPFITLTSSAQANAIYFFLMGFGISFACEE